ncbi:MAG TPA: NlpC/P60 family protein [Paracoccaceae bacterium]|nr:NlpC/P60 family protein [Paracoccaceae bacterium]HMO72855.1 NlpC/P60 family protein [Paracoccaceae bacterium]
MTGTDRRLTPATDRIAHVALQGMIEAPAWTEGEPAEVARPLADLRASPGGARDRQLLLGDAFLVIDRRDGNAFGMALKDGYCGWVVSAALGAPTSPGHWVAGLGSHLYPEPRVQAEATGSLTLGTRLRVLGQQGDFARTPHGWVPAAHLRPLGSWHADPAEVAGLFLGVPYLWGGNTRDGLDCSGLVQVAMLACGRACPGDSDLQRAAFAAAEGGVQRGDLLFWPGHVAMALDGETIIHANGHHMAVVAEPLAEAVSRIGPPAAHARP